MEFLFSDLGLLGAAIGAGIAALGAGLGIGRIAASSVESMARQPEVQGSINGAMILTAALIEGVALFACVICLLISFSAVQQVKPVNLETETEKSSKKIEKKISPEKTKVAKESK